MKSVTGSSFDPKHTFERQISRTQLVKGAEAVVDSASWIVIGAAERLRLTGDRARDSG